MYYEKYFEIAVKPSKFGKIMSKLWFLSTLKFLNLTFDQVLFTFLEYIIIIRNLNLYLILYNSINQSRKIFLN